MAITLNAQVKGDKKNNILRKEGKITAEVYGPDMKNQSVVLNYNEFVKVFEQAGTSSIVDAVMPDGKKYPVLISDTQVHPITSKFSHVDLRQVPMNEKLEMRIELKFTGDAPATKAGGVFLANKSELTVSALPADLVSEIEVDVSGLADFDDKIFVKDIKLPKGIEVLDGHEDLVASIGRQIEEEKPLATAEEEKAAIESVAVEKKGKEETEEDAEGKAPAEKKAEKKK